MAQTTNPGPFFSRVPRAHAAEQPFTYPLQREWAEPDWRRLPAFRDVTRSEWETAQWQRAHTVKNLRQLVAVYGDLFPNDLLDSIEKDQAEREVPSSGSMPCSRSSSVRRWTSLDSRTISS